MKVATLPLSQPFLDAVASFWCRDTARGERTNMAQGTLVVPTRRAARSLVEAFLRLTGGQAVLLPRILAIGSFDEAGLALSTSSALTLPPPVEPMHRLSVLTRLVLAAGPALGNISALDQAWRLAQALAELMDEAEWAECDLEEQLHHAVESDFSEHWKKVLQFLSIVTHTWPQWLKENDRMNPVARQVAVIRSQAQQWRQTPPSGPVWAVGFTDALPATADLLAAIVSTAQGQLVIPGIDMNMPEEIWTNLPDGHPQAATARLFEQLGLSRHDVSVWEYEADANQHLAHRHETLSRVLLPAFCLDQWQTCQEPADLSGVYALEASDPQEEAAAIALILRNTIEEPGRKAALVTPDRNLARRVATELARWGVIADDSAGTPLSATPVAGFLRCVMQALASNFTPVALLALLKHPLAACGMEPGACRHLARRLEVTALRGPTPRPGLESLRSLVAGHQDLAHFVDDLSAFLAPLVQGGWPDAAAFFVRLGQVAETLAATPSQPGAERLWSGEEGNAMAVHLSSLVEGCESLPAAGADVYERLFIASLEGKVVRGWRALRGRTQTSLHPRVFIWGLLEAQLQRADVLVLGGLVEGVWPSACDSGPWMSRPMRARVGLPSPERVVGQMAHDFLSSACAAREVVFSAPTRREGAPTVPARWLVRLKAFLEGRGQTLEEHPALSWLRRLDFPLAFCPVASPCPVPALSLRPHKLSITEIETWLRDPYAIYARHVLGLKPLPPLEEEADAADYGDIVHAGLAAYLHDDAPLQGGEQALFQLFLKEMQRKTALSLALQVWWRARLWRIALWVVGREAERRRNGSLPLQIATEIRGSLTLFYGSERSFTLYGRADRVDIMPDGGAVIFDYKTGILPHPTEVKCGWSPQLALEGMIQQHGGFEGLEPSAVHNLLYWRLRGAHDAGEERAAAGPSVEAAQLIKECEAGLQRLLRAYLHENQPYLSHPRLLKAPRYANYAQLARFGEWSNAHEGAADD